MSDLRAYFLKLDRWSQRLVPTTEVEMDKAVETLRFKIGVSAAIPHLALKKLLRPYFTNGWCLGAVEYALRWRPNNTPQTMFRDLGDTSKKADATRGWLIERQMAKWLTRDGQPRPAPIEAQTAEEVYRVMHQVLERSRQRHHSEAASSGTRESVVDEARLQERERQRRARHDRVAVCREKDRRERAALGDLARMAGMHDSENVREIPLPQWRSEGDRRQQTSELTGAARTGYLDFLDRVRERVAEQGSAAMTPELRRVIALRSREARAEASLAYMEQLIDETRHAG